MIYLDNNSTTKPSKGAILEMSHALGELWGNPSNIHGVGEATRRAIQQTACNITHFLATEDEASIGFTSGGTEANRQVIQHMATGCDSVAFLETEHSSVIDAYSDVGAINAFPLPVDANGVLDLKEFELKLAQEECRAISIQWANSETGVIQPIGKILELCEFHGATLHVDAAQVIGKITLDPELVGRIDFLTFTAHKMHGPQGVGVIVTGDRQADFDTLFPNSHTPNSPGIIAFGKVVQERLTSIRNHTAYLQSLRDNFETRLLSLHSDLRVNAVESPRIPNTSNIQFMGVDGAALVTRLDLEGVICSQVSACLTGRPEPSYVLTAMGIPEELARSSIRFSFSILNTPDEVDFAVDTISTCYTRLLKQSLLLLS
ncbi:aminotransferase class V-fold PLP-dependent enzyme [bacterium]|nr:aminotransferase class V-fold PLP-dependent enzyme [bacterium]MDB4304713.1 aminotransferase class V-fold PLP-dependent enzyme [Akkermansiaceae bacterium]MDB4779196.1 aminotransferase class V-fold PLP-dependent enzyme [bacterium]